MKHNPMPLPQLLEAIELYFDCEMTDAEERQLRLEVGATPHSHPAIDEARAVMGLRRPKQLTPSLHHSIGVRQWMGIAAAIAVIVTLAVTFMRPGHSPAGQDLQEKCVAYVNGRCITDEDEVIALMAQNLGELQNGADMAEQSMIEELEYLAPMIEKFDSELNLNDI
ncbi:hypothetical protein [uncultured Duncaniella sp.]|uniref:hypothetical protein n=1 Tax=uncultured Duncaniella sp. TaxID=2768039 RepID=UPI00262B5EDB|nr:hypothetical protein [uncultured Duncaniella sp.]